MPHRAELVYREGLATLANSLLSEKGRTAVGKTNGNGYNKQWQRSYDEQNYGAEKVD